MTSDSAGTAVIAAFVGLGANLGDAEATLTAAIAELRLLEGTTVGAVSSVYRSAPVDAEGPDYLNAVVRLDTRLDAQTLLGRLQETELAHGRERSFPNAPRTLDLDLLLYGDERIETPTLTVPHPRLHLRAFVVLPLTEIAPEVMIPGLGRASEHLCRLAGQRLVRLPR